MFTKIIAGAALVLALGLGGGTWALANKKADNCCQPGAACCNAGSPCCDDCCTPGCPCCYVGSPCCGEDGAKPAATAACQTEKCGTNCRD